MDLRVFYQKLRKIEREIPDEHVVMVSEETEDGGKAGIRTEVQRETAAKLIVEGRARLATAEEAEQFRAGRLEAYQEHARQQLANRISLNVVSGELEYRKPQRKQPA